MSPGSMSFSEPKLAAVESRVSPARSDLDRLYRQAARGLLCDTRRATAGLVDARVGRADAAATPQASNWK